MTFYVQGLDGHESMPLGKVFKKPAVEKIGALRPEQAVDENEHLPRAGDQVHRHGAAQEYQSVNHLPTDAVVLAEQIMSTPVLTLRSHVTANEALVAFRANQIRHLPVVSSENILVGIVSDRDLLRHLSGVTDNYQLQARHYGNERISLLMRSPVLTASMDTDVRYIARLFVEQHIGALPIVTSGKLIGIIARSDVLTAVMRHFVLELWA